MQTSAVGTPGIRRIAGGRAGLIPILVTGLAFWASAAAHAASTLTVTPLTWNIVGLDSNSPATGPYRFPVGARVCSSVATTNVAVDWFWDSANANINLRPGSLSSIALAAIGAGGCADAYFEVEVTRTAAAFDTTRGYHITATDASGPASSPTPRQLYVEHLISQHRNGITDIRLDGVSIPAGGTMSLMVGNTYDIALDGFTATQGYNQLETFINFPNTIFQVLAVNTTYSADSNLANVPNPNDALYANSCIWDNDPNSPNYNSCIGGDDKAGGDVTVTYTVRIVSGAGTLQTLNSSFYDFSGSSFHYNADFSAAARIASIVSPGSVTIQKTFAPKAIAPGGASVLSFKLTNPTGGTLTDINFADAFPVGVVVAATPGETYSGCGAGAFSPAPSANDTALSFGGATLGPNSVCTITVNVTAAVAGTYPNTTGHLFINTTTDTGNTRSDTLTVASAPACTPGQTLAEWTVPDGTTANPPDTIGGLPTIQAANVSSATASANVPGDTQITTSGGQGDTTSWQTYGYDTDGQYIDFVVDTSNYSGVLMSFDVANPSPANGPTSLVLSYDSGSGFTDVLTINSPAAAFTQHTFDFTGLTSTSGNTTFRLTATGANNNNTGASLNYDDIAFTGCSAPAPAPIIAKVFLSDPIVEGATSSLSFTISNTAAGNQALTGVAFTDVLPAGLSIADATSSQCGGTNNLTTTAATRTIALTGGVLAAGGSCTFAVTVTGTSAGQYDNVTGFLSTTENGTSTNYASASLTVIAPPVLAKSFAAPSIFTGGTSTLSFTVTNPNVATALSGIDFTDTLPAGVTVGTSGPTATCGGTLSTTAPDTIAFTGGALAANSACTFSVTVTGTTAGTKNNTTTAVTSTEGGDGNAAAATLVVADQTASIDITKQVSTNGAEPWTTFIGVAPGFPVYYRFKVYNSGDLPFTALFVSDPALASTSATPATCDWTPFLPLQPGQTAACVTGPLSAAVGTHPNSATVQGTYASGTETSFPSTATYATTGLTIAKTVAESFYYEAGDLLHYTYHVTNSGFAPLLGPVTINDSKATVTCPAVGTVGDLDNYLDPGESIICTATYTVTSGDMALGSVTNSAFARISGVNSNTTSKVVALGQTPTPTPTQPPDLRLTKRHSGSFRPGRTGVYSITVYNDSLGATTGDVTVTDLLPAGLTFVSGTGSGWSCSASGQLVTCIDTLTIFPGTFSLLRLTVSVSAEAAAVTINTATLSTPGDVNPANNTDSDETNVLFGATVTPARPFTPSRTPINVGSRTPTPSSTPINQGSRTPTRTATATVTGTIPTPTAVPTSTPGGTVKRMGVRFVSVARVNRNSTLNYSVAVVIYGRSLVPDVRATLTLPPEVAFVSAEPPPLEAPAVGSFGVVRWNFGDLQGPANRPVHVVVTVRGDVPFGDIFEGRLRVQNGLGEVVEKSRTGYVGQINYHPPTATSLAALTTRDSTVTLHAKLIAPITTRAGAEVRYSLRVSAKSTPGQLMVRSVVPAGLTVETTSPPATVDAGSGVPTTVEWSVVPDGRNSRFLIFARAREDVLPGTVLEGFADVNDGLEEAATVSATTTVR